VARWYFIKAVESNVYGFKNHKIPYNESFAAQFRKACWLIIATKNDGTSTSSDEEAYDKVILALT